MRLTVIALVCLMLAGVVAAQEEVKDPSVVQPRPFSLNLTSFTLGSYEASKELRLAVWDSPMTRLEFGVAREMLAMRSGGMTGRGAPTNAAIRMSVTPGAPLRLVLAGPWSEQWRDLDWQDRVAVAAESAVMVGILAALVHNLK